MKRVSFQGTRISATERQRAELQARIRAATVSPVPGQVAVVIAQLEVRKEEGAKPERQWFLDYQESGTPSICEHMGY